MSLLHLYDVSAYQGTTVPAADAVFVKATEGSSYTSSKFHAQYAGAKQRARHRGAYHFARPEASSARSQADRFLDVVRPVAGESLWLDLEASDLNQAKTHAWAVAWADRIRDQAPGITYGIYMGGGYATNNTGRGLAAEYPFWWYPQYPTSKATSTWPTTFAPWLPSGLTCGWSRPHIWQFSSAFKGEYDASVSTLTIDQLAGGGRPSTEVDVYGGIPPLKVGERYTRTCPKGSLNIWGIAYDSTNTLTYRIAAHSNKGGGEVKDELVVGGPNSASDAWPKKQTWKTSLTDVDWFSIELIAGDPSQPDANGRIVQPGWDASLTD
ncbi:hypothetical protein GCM10023191_085420 [Actinoallomurus oryzae]|jgi:hypothetical protein|uniref:Lysozyme n=1 Tax=Actinoallomurus oryzae TaxID=502180 RepID=A0ABP8R1I5_9ACTN